MSSETPPPSGEKSQKSNTDDVKPLPNEGLFEDHVEGSRIEPLAPKNVDVKPLPRDLVREVMNIHLGSVQPSVPLPQKSEHKPLPPEVREIVSTAVIRMAGYDENGKFLGQAKLLEDLETVLKIEKPLVIDPKDVQEQLQQLEKAKEANPGGEIDFQKISHFAALGAHATLNNLYLLLEMMKRKGYVMLLEYTIDGMVVPCGYIYGFLESFRGTKHYWQKNFQTLGVANIAAAEDEVERLIEMRDEIVTNWRTSIAQTFQDLADAGIPVPPRLLKPDAPPELQSPRMWGGGNALKRAVAAMGQESEATIIMLNIGTIQKIGEILGISIPNVASVKYNSEFVDSTGYSRTVKTPILEKKKRGRPRTVGEVRWLIFKNMIDGAIQRLDGERGVLRSKGGWELGKLDRSGRIIASIDPKEFYENAFKLQKSLPKARKRAR